MSMHTKSTSNLYHLKYVRKILMIILINDPSIANHSSKFTVLVVVVVAFTKKENQNISKTDRAASRANTHNFCEYRKRSILILCFVYNMPSYGESKSTTTISYVLLSLKI